MATKHDAYIRHHKSGACPICVRILDKAHESALIEYQERKHNNTLEFVLVEEKEDDWTTKT